MGTCPHTHAHTHLGHGFSSGPIRVDPRALPRPCQPTRRLLVTAVTRQTATALSVPTPPLRLQNTYTRVFWLPHVCPQALRSRVRPRLPVSPRPPMPCFSEDTVTHLAGPAGTLTVTLRSPRPLPSKPGRPQVPSQPLPSGLHAAATTPPLVPARPPGPAPPPHTAPLAQEPLVAPGALGRKSGLRVPPAAPPRFRLCSPGFGHPTCWHVLSLHGRGPLRPCRPSPPGAALLSLHGPVRPPRSRSPPGRRLHPFLVLPGVPAPTVRGTRRPVLACTCLSPSGTVGSVRTGEKSYSLGPTAGT